MIYLYVYSLFLGLTATTHTLKLILKDKLCSEFSLLGLGEGGGRGEGIGRIEGEQ